MKGIQESRKKARLGLMFWKPSKGKTVKEEKTSMIGLIE